MSAMVDNSSNPQSLSIVTFPYSCPFGFLVGLDIFAKGNLETTLKHFYHQMSQVIGKMDFDDKKVMLTVNVDYEIGHQFREVVLNDDAFKRFSVERSPNLALTENAPQIGIAVQVLMNNAQKSSL